MDIPDFDELEKTTPWSRIQWRIAWTLVKDNLPEEGLESLWVDIRVISQGSRRSPSHIANVLVAEYLKGQRIRSSKYN